MTDVDRRAFLTGVVASVAGVAGCQGRSTDEDTGDDKPGGQPTKTVKPGTTSGGTRLTFGETLSLPRVDLTLSNPRTMNAYDWHRKGESARRVAKAGEGKQWLKVDVVSVNTTERVVRLPLTMDFKGIVDETVYHPGRNKSPQEKYIGGKVAAGDRREGSMAFLLPADVPVGDVRVHYSERRPSGEKEASWVPRSRSSGRLDATGLPGW